MEMKKAAVRSVIIIVILVLSLVIGAAYNRMWYNIDLQNYPREYSALVSTYAAEYGVPEYVIYAVIKTESDFQSNFVGEDGRIGLMQLSKPTFRRLLAMNKASLDEGILYDPATNIEYGAYYLSYLYTEYNRWTTVFAAYATDKETVDKWLSDPEFIDEKGNLEVILDEEVLEFVENVNETIVMYKTLYYS
ncbi:MAG: lytic transglycosylase domain-containing protein [Ruminococcaceae bacterium]|nr:lytic transglycosylase domain-containing protein [Oscillospiraceae bacterium]